MPRRSVILDLRRKSLARGTIVTLGSLWGSLGLVGFPEMRQNLWLIVPLLLTSAATWDHTRCLQKRWSFYHGAVILLIYVDLMVLLAIAFLLVVPYSNLMRP